MSINSVIIGKIVTEKVTKMEKNNVYGFYVTKGSNKDSIKAAIKVIYGQVAVKVNVVQRPKEPRRVGKMRREIYDTGKKIAYVTLDKPLGKIITRS